MNIQNKFFNSQNNNFSRAIRFLPWIIAICFWLYNTTTCVFHIHLGDNYYPYKTNKIIVLDKINVETILILDKKISISKWDTDIENAPLSTITARVWTLFFYTITPFLILKLIQMAWGLSYFLNKFKNWIKTKGNNIEIVEPFNEDGYGGFYNISEVTMSYFYLSIVFIMLVVMSFFKEGSEPAFHDYILMYLLIPIAVIIFLCPLFYIKKIILDVKKRYLKEISLRLNSLFFDFKNTSFTAKTDIEKSVFFSELSSLKTVYKQIDNLKEWPFSASMIFRIIFLLFLPLSGIILDLLTNFIFDN